MQAFEKSRIISNGLTEKHAYTHNENENIATN